MFQLLLGVVIGMVLSFLLLKFLIFPYWQLKFEQKIRRDALERSRVVLKGKISEQIAPLLPEFEYKPSDARFLGSPIDYIVFDGYSGEGDVDIIFLEVKHGSSKLTKDEERIKRAVERKRVRWKLVKLP